MRWHAAPRRLRSLGSGRCHQSCEQAHGLRAECRSKALCWVLPAPVGRAGVFQVHSLLVPAVVGTAGVFQVHSLLVPALVGTAELFQVHLAACWCQLRAGWELWCLQEAFKHRPCDRAGSQSHSLENSANLCVPKPLPRAAQGLGCRFPRHMEVSMELAQGQFFPSAPSQSRVLPAAPGLQGVRGEPSEPSQSRTSQLEHIWLLCCGTGTQPCGTACLSLH